MREICEIKISGLGNGKLASVADLISKALVKDYKHSKSVMILSDGHYSEGSIDSIQPQTAVFIVKPDENHQIEKIQENENETN